MSMTVPKQGKGICLNAMTGKGTATQWTLRLYTNNLTWTNAITEASVTEATGGGYAAIALTAASWTTVDGSPESTSYPAQTFTFTGVLTTNPTIYGYYVTQADGKLLFGEALGSSFTPANNGDNIVITPVVTLASVTND